MTIKIIKQTMKNLITKTTELAMEVTLKYIKPGDLAVDATCGTGNDTVSLASAVGDAGKVIAFDIQEKAVELTGERLRAEGLGNVSLHLESFVNMDQYVGEDSASAVIFNLGYLPGGDHGITTVAETTLVGLEKALKVLKPGGILTVVLYDGHEEGRAEKAAVLEWARELDSKAYHVAFVNFINQANYPPEILWITKK